MHTRTRRRGTWRQEQMAWRGTQPERISIRLKSNEVPSMSPSLVKWIPLFHRVLLSGLVYACARLTTGPYFNRRSGRPVRAVSPRVGVLRGYYWLRLALCCAPLIFWAKRRMSCDVTRRMPWTESDLFDVEFYRVPRYIRRWNLLYYQTR